MSRERNWCFTLNNWTEDEYHKLQTRDSKYTVIGQETSETGTPHLQGYMELKNGVRLDGLKKDHPRIHWEKRLGTAQQAAQYCKKAGIFWEKGNISNQGKRNDITTVKEIIEQGGGMRDIIKESTSYQAIKAGEIILKYTETKRTWKPKVTWIWGPTGCGKTHKATEAYPNYWMSAGTLKWWDGYDAHENVIIDEFRADYCTFHELLRILDRYPFRVQTKGGSRELLAKNIVITSCYAPDSVYATREDIGQLLRRIDETIYLGTEVLAQKSGGNTTTPDLPELEDNIVLNI